MNTKRAKRRLDSAVFVDLNSFSFERFTNGATIQYREIFRRLSGIGVRCAIVTAVCAKGRQPGWSLVDGIPLLELPIDAAIEELPEAYIAQIRLALSELVPDLVLLNSPPDRLDEAELLLFELLADFASEVLCFVPDAAFPKGQVVHPSRLMRWVTAASKMRLVAPSQFVIEMLQAELGLLAELYPNLFDTRQIVAESAASSQVDRRVTFVNPHPMKGLAIMESLASLRPDLQFQFVKSWPYPPTFVSGLSNVEVVEFNADMRPVWERSSMLLVPSLCHEAFGRVVVEAQLNGIPVLYHEIGGLREAAGREGVSIEPPHFDGPIAFPTVRPDDLVACVRRWSRAIDTVMASRPNPVASKEAAFKLLSLGEQAFSSWVGQFDISMKSNRILVVAPHSDDAAFSIGGLLSEIGERSVVATLFSRSCFTAREGLGGDPDRVTAVRKCEDNEFASSIRAKLECCDLPEAALRFPKGFDDIFVSSADRSTLRAEESADLIHAIESEFDRILEHHRPNLMLLPLGLGSHRDHLIALYLGQEAARRWGVLVAGYEDLPYAASINECDVMQQATRLGTVTPLYSPLRRGIAAKIELCRHYASQLGQDTVSDIKIHARNLNGAERLWVTSHAAALALECVR